MSGRDQQDRPGPEWKTIAVKQRQSEILVPRHGLLLKSHALRVRKSQDKGMRLPSKKRCGLGAFEIVVFCVLIKEEPRKTLRFMCCKGHH